MSLNGICSNLFPFPLPPPPLKKSNSKNHENLTEPNLEWGGFFWKNVFWGNFLCCNFFRVTFSGMMISKIAQFWSFRKDLGIGSPPYFEYVLSRKCYSCYIPLPDPISLSDCLSYLRYWAICVLQLFFSQILTL